MVKNTKSDRSTSISYQSYVEKYLIFIIGLPIIFWACAFPLIKISLEDLSPANLAIIRLFFASLIFMMILIWKKDRFSPFQKKDTLRLFLLGFIGISVYHLTVNYGEQFISAGATSLIIATIPIFVVILAFFFLSEKINRRLISGVILALCGVVVISLWGNPNATIEIGYVIGALAVVVSAFVGAYYTIAGKKLLKRYNPLSLTVYAFLLGNLGLIPFISPSFFDQVSHMSTVTWGAVIFLACFPTVISYTLWYIALDVKQASELSAFLYAIPVIATFLSMIFLKEEITVFYVFGGFLVICGLYIVNKQRKKHLKLVKD